MKRMNCLMWGALMSSLLLPVEAPAACPPTARTVAVEPGLTKVPIAKSGLLSELPGYEIGGHTAPSHGSLEELGDLYYYRPHASFWTAGLDSFEIRLNSNRPNRLGRAEMVLLVPGALSFSTIEEGFENGTSVWTPYGDTKNLEIYSGPGAITGTHSLRLHVPVGSLPGWFEGRLGDRSGGQQGSTTQITIRPPRGGEPPPQGVAPGQVAFIDLGGANSPSSYRLWLEDNGSHTALLLQGPAGATPWLPVSRATHRIKLSQWIRSEEISLESGQPSRRSGAMLWVDDVLTATLLPSSGQETNSAAQALQTGILSTAGEFQLKLEMDDFAFSALTFDGAGQCLVGDGFEDGHPDSAWDWVPGGPVSVETEAALVGLGGLDAVLGTTLSGGALEASIDYGDPRLGFRFRLDPNSVILDDGGKLQVLAGVDPGSGVSPVEKRPFAVLLERHGAQYFLRLLAEQNVGATRTSGLIPIPDGPVFLTLDWRRSPSGRVSLGTLRLWVDGQLSGELAELDTFGQEVSLIRLGATAVYGSSLGHIHLDSFIANSTRRF